MEILDFSNTIRPFALLEIANCLKRLTAGKEMEIIGLDVGAIQDLRCILPAHTYDMRMGTSSADLDRVVICIRNITSG